MNAGHDQRVPAARKQIRSDRAHLLGPEAAVGADHGHAHVLHGLGKNLGRGAGEADALFEGHGGHDGQVRHPAHGCHCRPRLGHVELRFNEEEVAPAFGKGPRLDFEALDELLGVEVAQRPGKVARGSDVAGNADQPARGLRRLPGQLGHAPVEAGAVYARIQLEGARPEGAGGENVRAGFDVGAVHCAELLRPGQAVLAGRDAGRHAAGLEHGAHGAVEKERAVLGEQIVEARSHGNLVAGGGCGGTRRKSGYKDNLI